MPRVTIQKGLEGAKCEANTINDALQTDIVKMGLQVPDNPEFLINGAVVPASTVLQDGDVVVVQQKASDKA